MEYDFVTENHKKSSHTKNYRKIYSGILKKQTKKAEKWTIWIKKLQNLDGITQANFSLFQNLFQISW